MYYPNHIEDICYEDDHIEEVIDQIKNQFPHYFKSFIETEAGSLVSHEEVQKISKKFGGDGHIVTASKNVKQSFTRIVEESINTFEKDRDSYFDLLDEETLEEYEDDPSGFKSTLSRECPIIRVTLMHRVKQLDKYRYDFRKSHPDKLLTVCTNLSRFVNSYVNNCEHPDFDYNQIKSLAELKFKDLDTENYSVYGVIGGGIKSHLIYKLSPQYFPYRSKNALWALWFLTDKKDFGCEESSQFLMIERDANVTNQNYFYPYELFGYYAYQLYLLLREEAEKCGAHIPVAYRYVIVEVFLNFIASVHDEDIEVLSRDNGAGSLSWT